MSALSELARAESHAFFPEGDSSISPILFHSGRWARLADRVVQNGDRQFAPFHFFARNRLALQQRWKTFRALDNFSHFKKE